MKADKPQLAANLARLDPKLRLVLLHGRDEAASRDMARQIARQFDAAGDPLAQTSIAAATLKDDPSALAAAAAEVSMFGDRTLVRIDDAGEEVAEAAALLLNAEVTGNPVLIVAGELKKGSKLQLLAENSPVAISVISYAAEGRDWDAVADAAAAEFGLRLARGVARALQQASGGDRGVLRAELQKFALYLDASPAAPATLEPATLAAIGADLGDADINALVDAVSAGRPDLADQQMARLAEANIPGIVMLRGIARRFWLLLELRLVVDGGASPQAAVDGARPPVFWKSKAAIASQVGRYRIAQIRAALDRMLGAERDIKRGSSAGDVLARQAILGIATMLATRN
ncbi:MAG: DNA polymerase III subunit delta [Polymorphobacter sp.]